MFEDPTPNAIINQRLMLCWVQLFDHTDLTPEEREQLFRILLFVAVKMGSVWSHLDRYRSIEADLVEQVKAAPPPRPPAVHEVRVSQELFLELDEFLVQLKSTLDYLVKVPQPIVGRQCWNLKRFGDHGEAVRKALDGNLPRKYADSIPALKEHILDEHKDWLAVMIGLRDKLNHYLDGGVPLEQFGVSKKADGTVRVPMWNDQQTLGEAMEAVWGNFFRLVEDFVPLFLNLRRQRIFGLLRVPRDPTSAEPAWSAVIDPQLAASLEAQFAADKSGPSERS